MPNVFDATGLQVQSRTELVSYFTAQYQAIYGSDINLDSDTPDGQMMNIFIQAILDLEDLLVQVCSSFDPDLAIGAVLDQRCAINGVQRQPATYTITNETVVLDRTVNLYGLDGSSDPTAVTPVRDDGQPIYTAQDSAGNRWLLIATELGITAGTHVFPFRALLPGAELTIPDTITTPVTIVLGVTSVNNPTTYTTLGLNEETDAALRIRRLKSVSLASQGYLAGLLAALENISGVTSAFVYENVTETTDSDGVPGHSIWVIVAGSGDSVAIAKAIYTKRNAGCGMKGSETYNVTQVDGTIFTVRWDIVISRTVFIRFTATSINGTTQPAVQLIRADLSALLTLGVNATLNINQVATDVQDVDANTLVTSAGLSLGETQTVTLSDVPASGTFKIGFGVLLTTTLNWNDAIGTIQTAVRALAGLSAVNVTGSLASKSLVFNCTALADVTELFYISSSTMQSVVPAAITFAYDAGYTATLAPPTKQDQLVIATPNIIITAMQLLPATSSISVSESVQFSGAGGYGAYTFTISVNNTGGAINAASGIYTAGTTPATDTVKVTDVFGNSATATVTAS